MMSKLNLHYKREEFAWFNFIGWYQIIGGAIGSVGLLWLFAQNVSLLTALSIVVGIGLNCFSVYAGQQLLTHVKLKSTYIIQALQLLNFVGLGVTYQVVIGLALGFGFEWIDDAQVVLNFKLVSWYEFSYKPSQTDAIRVVINFVPVLIINYLMKCQERAEEQKRLVEYSSDSVE